MLRWLLRRKLASEEKKLGESVDYLRHVLDVSPTAFFRFASIMPFANSRKVLPKDVWYAAQVVALKQEDCGPCLQITVNLAQQDNVDMQLMRAVVDDNLTELPQHLVEVCEFTQSVLDQNDDDALRETIRERYGDRGLIELAYAISSARIPPTVKRVLGHAKSCRLVEIRTG